jgi:RNAse (barnase) inhibitor barstar
MKPNFWIAPNPQSISSLSDFFVAEIDGRQARTLRQFYEQMAKVLEFSDDFGFTMDSLDEMLNDLDWIEDEKIAIHITHTDEFIVQERDPAKLGNLLAMLDATAEDWKWVADDENAEAVLPKELIFVFDDGPRLQRILANEEIEAGLLPV